jgi:acetyl-CoA carboxylase biotin carboxylase subunit
LRRDRKRRRNAELRGGVRRPFRRILVANRGEIAVRIIRAARDLGIETVAVYSDADAGAAHVRLADEAVRIGPAQPAESYLRAEAIIDAARYSGAEAIHPGYGFLAERADFAAACRDAGLVFVGPSPAAIATLGDKLAARRVAASVGVPIVAGTLDPIDISRPDAIDAIVEEATRIGFPILVKAAAGGGGRGMRRVDRVADLPAALAAGASESSAAFGDGAVYLERLVSPARHVEVQLLGDSGHDVVALGERDCSIQRRHQKLLEEAPAPGLTVDERRRLHEQAVRIGVAAGLDNVATCEFLRNEAGEFRFLEVNARLQVEHGVTELVTGTDLVVEQFRLAAGAPISDHVREAALAAAEPASHAIEARISAEDPARDFVPTPGTIRRWVMPSGPGVRVDTAVGEGDIIPPMYDSLIAKIMVQAADRNAAIDRLRRALDETLVAGVQTTLPFHRFVADEPGFRAGRLSTDWVADHWDEATGHARARSAAAAIAALAGLGGVRGDAPAPALGIGPWHAAARADGVDRWPS